MIAIYKNNEGLNMSTLKKYYLKYLVTLFKHSGFFKNVTKFNIVSPKPVQI